MEINIIPKFLDSALTPVAKETGERLADIVNLVFTPIVKAKAIRDKNLELFLKDLEREVNCIPEDKLKDPKLYIVGPALEDVGRYYHDEQYLREKFAKLIASSLDERKVEFVHPIFKDIIEKLSEQDAELLDSLYHDREPHVLFFMPAKQVAFSLSILKELGLIDMDDDEYNRMFKEEERIYNETGIRVEHWDWEEFRKNKLSQFENYDIEFTKECVFVRPYKKIVLNNLEEPLSFIDIRLFKSYFHFTSLGERFCKICV